MNTCILIIDDSEDDRFFFKKAVSATGINASVLEADNGGSGLRMAREGALDCIFLDYNLPGMNGMDVLKSMRKEGIEIPVIMLTGQRDDKTIVHLLKEGAADYIPKDSMTAETLRLSIDSSIQMHQLRKEKKRAEEALRASETRLKDAQKIAHIGNWEYDFNSGATFLSEEARRILDYPMPFKAFPLLDFIRRIHEEDRLRVRDWIRHMQQSGDTDVSFRMRAPDNECQYIHLKEHNITQKDGKLPVIAGTIQDVTVLKNAIQETQKAQISRKATSIVLMIGMGVFLISEALLDPFIDALEMGLLIAISCKGFIALFLKPMETFLEKTMLNKVAST